MDKDEDDQDEQARIAAIFFDYETPRDQYYEAYPAATEAEIQMLLDAEKMNGHPPQSLAHAKQILGAPEPKPDYSYASALALEHMYMTAKWEDTEPALHASARERKALEAVKHDPESKPTKYGFPGVAALFLSRALQEVAEDTGDGQLMLYAADMERRARGVIGLYLSCPLPNETAH